MNEKGLQSLVKLAESAIPERVDMWPAVRAQVAARPKQAHSRRPLPRLVWAAGGLVMLVLFGLATYVGAGSLFDRVATLVELNDPGIHAVYSQALYHEIEESRSLHGVTLSVDWAYADPNRVIIGWHDETQDKQLRAMLESVQLVGGPVLENGLAMGDVIEPQAGNYLHSFWTPPGVQGDKEIALLVSFEISRHPIMGDPPGNGWTENEDGEWFYEPEPLGNVSIPLSIPVHQGSEIAVGQTVEAGGIPMTLERLFLAPSGTRVDLCFDVAGAVASSWGMEAEVRPGGGLQEPNFYHVFTDPAIVGNRACTSILVGEVIAPDVQRVDVQILKLFADDMAGEAGRVTIPGPWRFQVRRR